MTDIAEAVRSRLQFLNRVDDVQSVLMAQLCKVSTEDVETLSAMVKLAQEVDGGFHVNRVLTWNGGDVEKHAVDLDEEKRVISSSWS